MPQGVTREKNEKADKVHHAPKSVFFAMITESPQIFLSTEYNQTCKILFYSNNIDEERELEARTPTMKL